MRGGRQGEKKVESEGGKTREEEEIDREEKGGIKREEKDRMRGRLERRKQSIAKKSFTYFEFLEYKFEPKRSHRLDI